MPRLLIGLVIFAALACEGVLFSTSQAAERSQADDKYASRPPSFDPQSVPEKLRFLEGRIAYVTIPGPEAPVSAARGALMRGHVQALVVTEANSRTIPLPLAAREALIDRVALGYISDQDAALAMRQASDTDSDNFFVLLEGRTAVRIIAPRVNDGFASQVLPLTGKWASHNSEREIHLWIDSCFLKFTNRDDQTAFDGRHECR